ncbi:DHA1 family putative efflux transporter-like MFS transporter [Brevibacillus aydinogluensis]|jgi:DHA1 family putative efflux transporter-like MFS transporter|uniref:MFS transporter n=1 Tax=Brevibacillus TaxID=55080 RepID=UPI001B9B2898|nr:MULTISPECIES: MFS transporter [Brevibacillus]MBR8660946.1 MFS transporter [Brevibacillus sp. NL20B1]MDT3416225.1 DHA1 family putative efflux transporter-like MFS transporter [Brevibacillus aydinogluensis]
MSNTWRVYLLALVTFLVGTSEYVISGILDKISNTMGISVTSAGQLVTIFSLVYAIGTPILMALTAKVERQKLLVWAMGAFVIGNILSFVLSGYASFLAARVIMALGAGMVVVTALDIAAKIAVPGKQASAIATVVMGFTASLIIGVPLGRIVAAQFGWQSVFGILALAGLVAMFILYAILPRVQGDKPMPLSKQLAFLKNGNVALGLTITFFWLGGYSVAYTYISPYLLNVAGLKEGMLSGVLLAFGIASLVGSKFGGFSADKWGVFPTLSGGMLLHVIALLLLSLTVTYTHSWLPIVILLILWSFSAWSSGPTQQVNLVRIEPNYSGIMLSLNQSMMQLSMAAGAAIGGVMVDRVSLSSITWAGMVGVAIAIVVVSFLRMRMSAGSQGAGQYPG